jgi:protein SCO1
MKSPLIKLPVLLAAICFSGIAVQAQSPAEKRTAEPSAAQKYFTDTELLTQDGKHVRFYTDVLKDRVVVINCFFATCKGSCLPMNRNMARLQQMLPASSAKNVLFVSISVDPEHDTPERLKTYASGLRAQPGWLFLTGTKTNVDFVHYKLGQYVEDKNQHNNILIIGNERTGLWKKAFGLAKAEELLKVLESVLNDSTAAASVD